jgi:hypothetical protein
MTPAAAMSRTRASKTGATLSRRASCRPGSGGWYDAQPSTGGSTSFGRSRCGWRRDSIAPLRASLILPRSSGRPRAARPGGAFFCEVHRPAYDFRALGAAGGAALGFTPHRGDTASNVSRCTAPQVCLPRRGAPRSRAARPGGLSLRTKIELRAPPHPVLR